jgi:hypothetical protein
MSTHLWGLSMFSPLRASQSEGMIDVHTPVRPVNVPSLACRPTEGLIDVHTPVGPVNVFSLACKPI